jgi:hypothetical protein
VPGPATVVVVVDGTDVVDVTRATTCDELPAPQAVNVTATPLSSAAVTSLGVFMSNPPRAPRSKKAFSVASDRVRIL